MGEYRPALAESSDDVASIFEPDVVLPSQFYSSDGIGLLGGERRLMAAILSDGIEAYLLSCGTAPSESRRDDARDWVETKDPGYVFSFDSVCACLGIDPDYLRMGLTRYIRLEKAKRESGGDSHWKKIRRPRK